MFPKPPGIPVFVMLPLDSVTSDGAFKYASAPWFAQSLHLLANSGAYGVAVDVWWGAVEREPGQYTWNGYKQLLELIRPTGLKLQIVLSFHACGGNVGDTAHIPLPPWVLRCGENDPDIYFTDRPRGGSQGQRNREYLSFWADDALGVLSGRSPMQCYEDFMTSFRENFVQDLGSMVEEVVVGAGPCGELRFPSYVEANGWRFPGVGEFQCYDRRALASLAAAARERGCPEWGFGGPHDTGDYNSNPEETGFYNHEGSWDSPYGRFFLEWYSRSLMQHGDRLMGTARRVFQEYQSRSMHRPSSSSAPSPSGRGADAPSSGQPHSHGCKLGRQGQQAPQAQAAGARTANGPGGAAGIKAAAGSRSNGNLTNGIASNGLMPSDGEHSDASSMSLPDHDADSVEHPLSERSSGGGMAQGGLTGVAARATALTPAAVPSLGTISQQSDSTDVLTAANPTSLMSSESARGGAVDRTCSTVYMLNLLVDDSSECMTPDNASAATADEAQPGEEQPGSSGQAGAAEVVVTRSGAPPQPAGLAAEEPDSQAPGLREGSPARKELALTLKIAGIHWWFRSRSHAAELTAGYYNTATRDGYGAVVELCVKHRFSLTLTCVEMCDTQHPPPALCGPEGLLKQVRSLCANRGVPLSGENALPIFLVDGVDSTALERIVFNTRVWHGAAAMSAYWHARGQERAPSPELHLLTAEMDSGSTGSGRYGYRRSDHVGSVAQRTPYAPQANSRSCQLSVARSDPAIAATGLRGDSYADISDPLPPMRSFTFLRLAPQILQPSYQAPWMKFMWKMREGGFC